MIRFSNKANYLRRKNRFRIFKKLSLVYKIQKILIKIDYVTSKTLILMKYYHQLKKISR